MKRYSLDHCFQLYSNSCQVFHAEEVVKELKLLHELGHCNRDDFIPAARARFSVVSLEGLIAMLLSLHGAAG